MLTNPFSELSASADREDERSLPPLCALHQAQHCQGSYTYEYDLS